MTHDSLYLNVYVSRKPGFKAPSSIQNYFLVHLEYSFIKVSDFRVSRIGSSYQNRNNEKYIQKTPLHTSLRNEKMFRLFVDHI